MSRRHRILPLVRSAGGTMIELDLLEVMSAAKSAPDLPERSGGKIAEMRGGVHQDELADLAHSKFFIPRFIVNVKQLP